MTVGLLSGFESVPLQHTTLGHEGGVGHVPLVVTVEVIVVVLVIQIELLVVVIGGPVDVVVEPGGPDDVVVEPELLPLDVVVVEPGGPFEELVPELDCPLDEIVVEPGGPFEELVIEVIELLLAEVLIELVDERLVVEVGGGTLLDELLERDRDVVVETQGKGGAV